MDKELGWAASLGVNTLRVYLHDLVWTDDEQGLFRRMDQFLALCQKHGICPWFVFFDDCQFPRPQLGGPPLPVKADHNSDRRADSRPRPPRRPRGGRGAGR